MHRILPALLLLATPILAEDLPKRDQIGLFEAARAAGQTGIARKTRPVDARPAVPGEVVVTVIAGEGVETRSKPAEAGDWVVRNRCPATGNEEILVKAAKFPDRYGDPLSAPDAAGWRTFAPRGGDMGYLILPEGWGAFTFDAPWGEPMVARPGDALVQVPGDAADTYRIAAAAFACTYEVVAPAKYVGIPPDLR